MPEYPGGEKAIRKDISETVKYPDEAKKKGISGKVYVSFVVDENGKVKDAKIARGVDPMLDKESLRVVNDLKTWVPGKEKGKAVKVVYTVPINFALDSKTPVKKNGDVYFTADVMPKYPGGEDVLKKFLMENVEYPATAKKEKVQGKVYVSFIVDKNGAVADAKIARGVAPSLDQEALRVV